MHRHGHTQSWPLCDAQRETGGGQNRSRSGWLNYRDKRLGDPPRRERPFRECDWRASGLRHFPAICGQPRTSIPRVQDQEEQEAWDYRDKIGKSTHYPGFTKQGSLRQGGCRFFSLPPFSRRHPHISDLLSGGCIVYRRCCRGLTQVGHKLYSDHQLRCTHKKFFLLPSCYRRKFSFCRDEPRCSPRAVFH